PPASRPPRRLRARGSAPGALAGRVRSICQPLRGGFQPACESSLGSASPSPTKIRLGLVMTENRLPPISCGVGDSSTQNLEVVKKKGIHRPSTACPPACYSQGPYEAVLSSAC